MTGDRVVIQGDISSQFISALLIASQLGKDGLAVHLTTPLTSRLYGALPLPRFKESDRIAVTARFLWDMGAEITETDDGCIIAGAPAHSRTKKITTFGDHRIMMVAASSRTHRKRRDDD